ncbi:transporter substrate-binding domain-containing protein [Salinimicrobium oceani]|uniref:Transporter substrate-binding domain-containing protein n=1 Tax=Salinimicrobium oceani TaxID=2722702 RepID=A0ABX1CXM7_9FLAO|nr:transporter substrate-binding domain-containing protein [Salinimicrobium oceani]NJW51553.1 transporter substrate-binding domain-containing protein [Salinimicrobium oceani]
MRIILLLFCLLLGSCTFPKDPEGSFEEAKSTGLKVGLVENPPYVIFEGKEASGSEVKMLREFAAREGLQLEFTRGSESELVKELHNYHLHIVAGGMEKKTIWKKKAGLSTPYDSRHVFLIPRGENKLLERLERYIFSKKKKG